MTQQEYYEAMLQRVPCGILELEFPLSSECRIHAVNQRGRQILNLNEDHIDEGLLWMPGLMDEDNQKYARCIFGKLRSLGDRQPFVLRLYAGAVEGEAEIVHDSEGFLVVRFLFLEISGEIAVRRREAEQKELLESVLESVHCGVIRFAFQEDEQKIVLVNQAGWKLLDYSSAESCTADGLDGILKKVHPEDRIGLLRSHCGLSEQCTRSQQEVRLLRQDSGVRWIRAEEQLLRDAHGDRMIQMTMTDITAQKQLMEQQAQENGDIIQSLGMIYEQILYINAETGAYRIIKGSFDARVGDMSFCFETDVAQLAQHLYCGQSEQKKFGEKLSLSAFRKRYTEGVRLWEHDFVVTYRGNESSYYRVEAVITAGSNGPSHIILGVRDVTALRFQELQERDALLSACETAQQASQAKTDFLSHMSHDIRTPMNAIVGLTQIMQQHIDDREKLNDCLSKIDDASQLLLNLINDVLDMSRVESGKVVLDEKNFDLREVVRHIKLVLKQDVTRREQQFYVELKRIPVAVIGDPLRVQQILLNLLSNAIKFTPNGGRISLSIYGETLSSSQYQSIHFVVQDTGIGMSKAFIDRIFQPFEREENSEVEQIQGSGLGMTIVSNLVQLMNGWIEIQSEQGKGSQFHVMLPMRPESQTIAESQHAISVEKPDLTGKRILLVEDNRVNLLIATELLKSTGATVEQAENGRLAVERFTASEPNRFDLIFMDIRMPELDGYGATRAIRMLNRPDAAAVPIIAMTANAFAEDVQEALRAGMNGHLAKPIQLNLLYDTLQRWLGQPSDGKGEGTPCT